MGSSYLSSDRSQRLRKVSRTGGVSEAVQVDGYMRHRAGGLAEQPPGVAPVGVARTSVYVERA
jgi:hypothetical protein